MSGAPEREGVLVVADRQVLWMADAITPHYSQVGYGYVGRVGVHERLDAVRADMEEKHGRVPSRLCTQNLSE